MRKVIWLFLVFTIISCGLLPSYATDSPTQTWNLPKNILGTQNQLSFNQGAAGVWYFMEAASQVHEPLTYRLLPDYTAPCDNWGPVVGIGCWETSNVVTFGQHSPFVSVNFTDHALPVYNVHLQARSLFLNPSETQLTMVAWKSPIAGKVHVTGSFEEFNGTCGNGVHWSVEKGRDLLASGDIASGGGVQGFDVSDVTVIKDQTLYFLVDSLGDRFCDEAILKVTITKE